MSDQQNVMEERQKIDASRVTERQVFDSGNASTAEGRTKKLDPTGSGCSHVRFSWLLLAVLTALSPALIPYLHDEPVIALAASFLCVYVLPGLAVQRILFPRERWIPDIAALSFGISFSLCLLGVIALVELRTNMDMTVWAWSATTGLLLAWSAWTSGHKPQPEPILKRCEILPAITGIAITALVLFYLWHIGGTYGNLAGEEGYHIIFTRKIHSNAVAEAQSLFYLPSCTSTYIYLPYHFSLALMAKLSALDPLSVFIKFRPFAALITFTFLMGTAKRLCDHRMAGWLTLNLVAILAFTNHVGRHSGYFAQFIPTSHHSDIALGMLVAMGIYFMWRGIVSEKLFGTEFICGILIGATVLWCHAREGIQLIVYAGILCMTLLLARLGNRIWLWHATAYTALLFALGKGYQIIQSARAGHLSGWDQSEKLSAVSQFKAIVERAIHGDVWALLTPRVDTSYMPGFEVYFMAVYSLALLLCPLVLLKARKLWAFFIPTLAATIIFLTRLPVTGYAMIIGGYSYILFTPQRFIMHWEILMLGVSVYYATTICSGSLATNIAWLSLMALSGFLIIPRFASALETYNIANPDTVVIYVLAATLAAVVFRTIQRSVSGRKSRDCDEPAVIDRQWSLSIPALALLLPLLLWCHPPTLPDQLNEARKRPSGLDVQQWCNQTDLLDLPQSTADFVRALPAGRMLAYDPFYVFNLPVAFNHYVFSIGYYYSSEHPFLERFYQLRNKSMPAAVLGERVWNREPGTAPLLRYLYAYTYDLMLGFPLYNWLDPVDITLSELRDNKIEYVISNPDFDSLWNNYASVFPEAILPVHKKGGYAVYRIDSHELANALNAVQAHPEHFIQKDIENGFSVRAIFSLERWKKRLSQSDYDSLAAELINGLPVALASSIPPGDREQRLSWLTEHMLNVPAQKHYGIDVKPDRMSFSVPIFLPKSKEYALAVKSGNGKVSASLDGQKLPFNVIEKDGSEPVFRFVMKGGSLHLLEVNGGSGTMFGISEASTKSVETRMPWPYHQIDAAPDIP